MSTITSNEADILARIIDPQNPRLSPEAARSILSLAFGPSDVERMNELSEKAAEGTLSSDEQEQLNAFERVGHMLALLQSLARNSLSRQNSQAVQS